VKCKGCGAPITIPITENIAILKCMHCDAEYEYDPTIKVIPKLVFERGDRPPLGYELNGSVIIGRESGYGYIKIRSVIDESVEENTHIRNPFVSRVHARIDVKEEYLLPEGDTKKVVVKKKCFIKDLGSRFGTTVNNVQLQPNELKELQHNAQIVLSVKSDLPLVIYYKELG
jgi:pSer/pThr/pTyr-binding forkhead associated (FHA) protein